MRKTLFIFILILGFNQSYSQDIEYARSTITKLCSPKFHGRGYVNKGDNIAAKFIKKEIEKIGLIPYEGNYFQKFNFPVNTFPSNMMIQIDEEILIPGIDYLVNPSSSSIKGKYKLAWINKKVVDHREALKNMLANDLEDYFIVIDTSGVTDEMILELIEFIKSDNPIKAAGIIEIVYSNLTYRVSTIKKSFPYVQIMGTKLNPDKQNINIRIKNKFRKKYKTNNIIGYIPGETDSSLVFTAHYDHLGRMGQDIYFPGAHDNASGSAMILDLAKHYKSLGVKPHYSMVFIWFAGEEAGLLGSKYFTENPLFPLEKIKFLYNIDMIGSGEDGIKVVNGSVFPNEFDRLVSINNEKEYLKKISARGEAANSDHYYFYEKGVKSFFTYTLGSYKEYHNIHDIAKDLPLNEYNDLFLLLTEFYKSFEPK